VWSFGTVFAIYTLGQVAEKWLKDFSWVALALAVVAGLATTFYLRRRAAAEARALRAEAEKEPAATP
jgi:hypothetical protein